MNSSSGSNSNSSSRSQTRNTSLGKHLRDEVTPVVRVEGAPPRPVSKSRDSSSKSRRPGSAVGEAPAKKKTKKKKKKKTRRIFTTGIVTPYMRQKYTPKNHNELRTTTPTSSPPPPKEPTFLQWQKQLQQQQQQYNHQSYQQSQQSQLQETMVLDYDSAAAYARSKCIPKNNVLMTSPNTSPPPQKATFLQWQQQQQQHQYNQQSQSYSNSPHCHPYQQQQFQWQQQPQPQPLQHYDEPSYPSPAPDPLVLDSAATRARIANTDRSGSIDRATLKQFFIDTYGGRKQDVPLYEITSFLASFQFNADGKIGWEDFQNGIVRSNTFTSAQTAEFANRFFKRREEEDDNEPARSANTTSAATTTPGRLSHDTTTTTTTEEPSSNVVVVHPSQDDATTGEEAETTQLDATELEAVLQAVAKSDAAAELIAHKVAEALAEKKVRRQQAEAAAAAALLAKKQQEQAAEAAAVQLRKQHEAAEAAAAVAAAALLAKEQHYQAAVAAAVQLRKLQEAEAAAAAVAAAAVQLQQLQEAAEAAAARAVQTQQKQEAEQAATVAVLLAKEQQAAKEKEGVDFSDIPMEVIKSLPPSMPDAFKSMDGTTTDNTSADTTTPNCRTSKRKLLDDIICNKSNNNNNNETQRSIGSSSRVATGSSSTGSSSSSSSSSVCRSRTSSVEDPNTETETTVDPIMGPDYEKFRITTNDGKNIKYVHLHKRRHIAQWNAHYQNLVDFRERQFKKYAALEAQYSNNDNGTKHPPLPHFKGFPSLAQSAQGSTEHALANWLYAQRRRYRLGRLPDAFAKKLTAVGYCITTPQTMFRSSTGSFDTIPKTKAKTATTSSCSTIPATTATMTASSSIMTPTTNDILFRRDGTMGNPQQSGIVQLQALARQRCAEYRVLQTTHQHTAQLLLIDAIRTELAHLTPPRRFFQWCDLNRTHIHNHTVSYMSVWKDAPEPLVRYTIAYCLREAIQEEERKATEVEVCHPNYCDEEGDIII